MSTLLPVNVPAEADDGFTSTDVDAKPHLTLPSWEPRARYRDVSISKLEPGSGGVHLVGRVVNCYEQPTPNKMPPTAVGCLKLHLRDDSGTIIVSQPSVRSVARLKLSRSGCGSPTSTTSSDSVSWFRSGLRISPTWSLLAANTQRSKVQPTLPPSFQSVITAATSWSNRMILRETSSGHRWATATTNRCQASSRLRASSMAATRHPIGRSWFASRALALARNV